MTAVYNEIDPFAAATLRELIREGHIAPGEVWENDIRDIKPSDLAGVTQFHAFAGFGVWSYAARRAGWPDHRPLWSMSCPCQPFSAAGAGAGFADERHLWPHACHLVAQCRPAVITGEQVASKDADPWIDLVQSDLEALGYAFGAVPFPSASVGAPHIRDRTYWMANASGKGSLSGAHRGIHSGEDGAGPRHGEFERQGAIGRLGDNISPGLQERVGVGRVSGKQAGTCQGETSIGTGVHIGGVADANGRQLDGQSVIRGVERDRQDAGRSQGGSELEPCIDNGGLEHSHGRNASSERQQPVGEQRLQPQDGSALRQVGGGSQSGFAGRMERPGPTNGFWRDPDWLFCRDGKWRPVEPGTFPLAHGAPARVGRLRGYGNAINAVQAQIFIEEIIEILNPQIDGAAGRIRLTEGIFG